MKRILIFTGKGGVGKTSVAAAHALSSAKEGKKTLIVSTDMAHNLGDIFEVTMEKEIVPICENLYALEIDPNEVCQKDYANLMNSLEKMIGSMSKDKMSMDEFTIIPGMDELFCLLKIQEIYRKGDYERIIVDCAPTGETLSLLKFPELLCWYMDKFFPVGKVAVRILNPFSKALYKIELPDSKAMNDIQKVYLKLVELQELLKNKEITSVRLVTIPEKMVVEETKRNYMYMNLYNYNVDGIFINRILPMDIDNSFFDEWVTIQQRYVKEIKESFGHVPMYEIPWYDTDLVGIASVERIVDDVLAPHNDLFEIKTDIEGESYTPIDNGYEMRLYLPGIKKDDVNVHFSGTDLIVKIGNYKRNIPLPNSLLSMNVQGASYENETLKILFMKEEQ